MDITWSERAYYGWQTTYTSAQFNIIDNNWSLFTGDYYSQRAAWNAQSPNTTSFTNQVRSEKLAETAYSSAVTTYNSASTHWNSYLFGADMLDNGIGGFTSRSDFVWSDVSHTAFHLALPTAPDPTSYKQQLADAENAAWLSQSTLGANDQLVFEADNGRGGLNFKYTLQDSNSGATAAVVDPSTGQEAAMTARVHLVTADQPTDPLFTDQWYLDEINVLPVWNDGTGHGYTGKGIHIAQYETGGPFSVGPEVFDITHPDLQANVDQQWLNDPNSHIPQTFSNHATLVAGVMVAARNDEGAVGVAYDAKLSGHYIPGSGLEVGALETQITDALAGFKNYDVVNNSWGATNNFLLNVVPQGELATGILDAVTLGRHGLGTAIVMAGGNDRQNGGNTNTSALSANRAVITTGAINAKSDLSALVIGQAPFSNPGASILISAPGSNIASTSRILMGDDGTIFGDSTSVSQGTSFATPIISGVVALMLEANPNLGWRDIQSILAITAKQVSDPNTDNSINGASNWNGGGMHVSHDYGFGEVDARATVRLAETWIGAHTSYNERRLRNDEGTFNGGADLNLALTDGATLTRTLSLGAGLRAEHVNVSIDITHSNWGDLTVELISPSGTVSKLVTNPGTSATNTGGDVGAGNLQFTFDTTHSYGENVEGNWQLKITDRSGGGTGVLHGWQVFSYGSDLNETFNSRDLNASVDPVISTTVDNTYFYTDEFATAIGAARTTLIDTDGGHDFINASAVSGNSVINLNNGSLSTIAGRNLSINGDVEYAFGGDGNDTLTGNISSNRLVGGRGNDSLNGGAQLDVLDGGQGNDTLTGGTERDLFIIRPDASAADTITDFSTLTAGEKIILVGFDGIQDFSQVNKMQEGADVRLNLPSGQSVLLQNVSLAQLTEQSVMMIQNDTLLELYMPYMSNSYFTGDANPQTITLPTTYVNLTDYALAGNDTVYANTNNDYLDGGLGNDVLFGDYNGTTVGDDWLEGGAGNDYLSGDGGADLLMGGSGDDDLYGSDGSDFLIGGSGNDYLDGGNGADILLLEGDGVVDLTYYTLTYGALGGTGNDVFLVTNAGGGSAAHTEASVAGVTQLNASNMIGDFTVGSDVIDLSQLTDVNRFSDLIITSYTTTFNDVVTQIRVGNNANSPYINLFAISPEQITATDFVFHAADAIIQGTSGNDALIVGDAGGNIVDGGLGADTMEGRTGDDTYLVDNVGDKINELPGGGFDTAKSSVSYTLDANVENLILTGSANLDGTGNAAANRITGTSGNNVLDGKGGVDTLLGGLGDDTYIVDSQADTVIENRNAGTDTVLSSVSYTLGNNLENLTLTGTQSINATGNNLGNMLTGNAGDNMLDGAEGADSMAGGAGDDTYFVDNAGDIVTENLNAGIDTVYAAINTTLSDNVENLILGINATAGTGNALDNVLIGNDVNNTLTGLAGADYLDAGAGVDTLLGGTGDDTYIVDVIKSGSVAVLQDTVTEIANEGIDTLQLRTNSDLALSAATTLTLATNLENLDISATGSNNLNITGNGAANTLVGNAANNILTGLAGNDYLDGGLGADSMNGGTEDDTYVVDNIGDVVTETASQGNDTIISSIGFNLTTSGNNVENLTLTGFDSVNATGNGLVNTLIGNAGSNILDGAAGNDQLKGGAGDDTYLIDAGDVITELTNQGVDTVRVDFTYTLGNNLENLTLTGTSAINGVGNDLDNVLTGNAAANTLNGYYGNDTLIGGAGNDAYFAGGDVGSWNITTTIIENDITAGNVDTLQLQIDLNYGGYYSQLSLVRESNDLIISGYWSGEGAYDYGNYENVRIQNHFAGTQYQVENVIYGDGSQSTIAAMITNNAYDYKGTSSNDVIVGDVNAKSIDGGAGNDTITGSARSDWLRGGEGQDSLKGESGSDYLQGGNGNDTLNGGIGSDHLYGDAGEDVYEFGRGYGSDIVTDIASEKSTIKLVGINSTDANVKFERGSSGYYFNANDSYLKITIDNNDSLYFSSWWTTESDNTNRLVEFADGVVLNLAAVDNRQTVVAATSGNDVILGSNRADTINGGAGDDKIYGYDGSDIINGGTGRDQLFGGEGDDQLFGDGDDVLDGGMGADIMNGGAHSTFYVDNVGDVINAGDNSTIISSLNHYVLQNSAADRVKLVAQEGANRSLTGNANINILTGNSQNNLLVGLDGNDFLYASPEYQSANGFDILQGGNGDDVLEANFTAWYVANTGNVELNYVLDGGAGNDRLSSTYWGPDTSVDTSFLVGGKGNDQIFAGFYQEAYYDSGSGYDGDTYDPVYVPEYFGATGNDIVAFNFGDDQDTLFAGDGAKLTLSIGGGIKYSDMSLSKSGNDLILKTGVTDSINLKSWYNSVNNHSVLNLQVIAEVMQGFTLGGSDQLRNNKIENFNFADIVAQFDAEGDQANWQLTDARLTAHLQVGSDTAAIGGDLAYQYGKNSNLTGMGLLNAQSVISAANFGQTAQAMNDPSVWQAELVKLG